MFIHDQYYIFVFGIEYPRVPGAGAEFMRWRSQTSIYIMGGFANNIILEFAIPKHSRRGCRDSGIHKRGGFRL